MTVATKGNFWAGAAIGGGFYDRRHHRIMFELNAPDRWLRGIVTSSEIMIVHGAAGMALRSATENEAVFVKKQLLEYGKSVLSPDIEGFLRA